MDEITGYDDLGVPRVINCVGTRTQVGGSLMRPKTLEAMRRASEQFVYMTELQAAASEVLAAHTGGEAGMVTAGTASGLTLATAACIAGDDYEVMASLPGAEGVASEVVIPKAHRIKYDVAFRLAGAELVDVGHVSHHPVDGGSDVVRPWEIDAAIGEETAAVAYIATAHNQLSLETVADVAARNDVPVIVDAAQRIPPTENLHAFFEQGADLVAFSAGKSIRGPQSTGYLVGRADLVASAAVQHLSDGYTADTWNPPAGFIDPESFPEPPPKGIGRTMKVAKEDVVGALHAFTAFLNADRAVDYATTDDLAAAFADEIDPLSGFDVTISAADPDDASAANAVVAVDPSACGTDAAGVVTRLREGDPRVWVGERRIPHGEFVVEFKCLTPGELETVVERLHTLHDDGS